MIDNFSHVNLHTRQNGKLIFKSRGVKNLPKNIFVSSNDINYIDISENKFTVIPDVITEIECLEALLCSHNNIRCLSTSLGNLIYLEILDLSCNHLTSLHSSICKLECLKILILNSNRLVSLPKSIGALKNLEELDASCNSLTCLPDELCQLKQLKFLNLRHNKLLDVPSSLSTLSIEILDLSENQLSSIPSEYHLIETLQTFNLSGNPLTFPPVNVCNRGLLHVMKFLQSEFRRQNQRQHIKLGSQISTDFSTINNNQTSDSFQLEINPSDSVKSISTTSFPSAVDFEEEEEEEEEEADVGRQDAQNYKYLPQTELISKKSFSRQDSGYNTITNASKYEFIERFQRHRPSKAITTPIVMSNSATEHCDSNTVPISPSYKDLMTKESQNMVGRHFKKNKNYSSTFYPNPQIVSPQAYRFTRFFPRDRVSEPIKVRRNSLPSDEYVTQTDNFADHDVDISSECVVVIDNSNNETCESHSSQDMPSISAQMNNNNAFHFNKIYSYNSLRAVKSKSSDGHKDRNSSTHNHVNGIIMEKEISQNKDFKRSNEEVIRRFHKIIEAQLHVHINSKDLSKELSNGIYLCHLTKILIPNSISIVHTPSPGQQDLGKQKSKRNLDNFLETCRRNGVPEDHLFSAREVINCNPHCLIQMAHSVNALINSIRIKESRTSSNCRPWRDVLVNPHSLSSRHCTRYIPRLSAGNTNTIGRSNRSIEGKRSIKISKPKDEIIHISSEV